MILPYSAQQQLNYLYNQYLRELKELLTTMGQCAGTSKKKISKTECYWKEPQDTYKYQKVYLPRLPFHGSLSNLKLKNCSNQKIGIRAVIQGIDSLSFNEKPIKKDMSASWQTEHKFSFEKTLFELKKSFVEIFLEENQENVGYIKINLFIICNGPFHQDFAIKTNKGDKVRLSFDLKISQIIQVQLESIEASIDFLMERPDERFNFSIKTIIGKNTTLEVNSRKSYDVKVLLDGGTNIDEDEIYKDHKQEKEVVLSSKNLKWSKKVCEMMPSIGIKTLVSELHHSYFQILIWKINDKKVSNLGEEKSTLFGECFIALQKMFNSDPIANSQDPSQLYDERYFESQQKIWYHGRKIGMGNFKFKVRSQKYTRQVQVLVRTEEGIKVYSPSLFLRQGNNKPYHCEYLIQIAKTNSQIQKMTQRLEELKEIQNFSSFESRRIKVELEEHLKDLFNILLKAEERTENSYHYGTIQELIQAQHVFIELGFKMTYYLEQDESIINEICWKILIALLKRGELTLVHLGFDSQEKFHLKNGNINKELEKKIQIALDYQKFLNKQLQLALKSIIIRGVEIQRNFAQIFLAYAYFRIPGFRNKFFEAIIKKDDPQIQEWRGTEFSLQNDIDENFVKEDYNTFSVLCDWQNNFYKCLEKEEKAMANFQQLEIILNNEEWKAEMQKRSTGFFYFLIYWVEEIERATRKSKDIQWKYFPGYNKLIKCFLVEMKTRPILEYPDALKVACYKLLSNEKLLNSIIAIILSKGNIYQPLTVLKSIEFINDIFMELDKNQKKIPGSFNYYLLYKAIKLILEGDFCFAMSKTLLMLYNSYKMFHLQFRRNIGMLLLGKVFFKLFLHWSYDVRDIFYHLIIMRIYRQSLNLDNTLTSDMRGFQQRMNEQMRIRYRELMDILERGFTLKTLQKKQEVVTTYEKHLYKTLKNKLYEKKKRKRKDSMFERSDNQEKESEEIEYQPPCSPLSAKNQIEELMNAQKFANSHSSQLRRLERSQSEIVKSTMKFTFKVSARHQNDIKRHNNDFRHEIYDIKGGKKVPLPKSAQIVNKYEVEDFQIGEVTVDQLEYVKIATMRFRKIRELLNHHSGDKQWSIPNIKMEMRLDIRESRPETIGNF